MQVAQRLDLNYIVALILLGRQSVITPASCGASPDYAGQDAYSGLFSVLVAQVYALGEIFGDPALRFAREANEQAFDNQDGGLLYGPRHAEHETDPIRLGYLEQVQNETIPENDSPPIPD